MIFDVYFFIFGNISLVPILFEQTSYSRCIRMYELKDVDLVRQITERTVLCDCYSCKEVYLWTAVFI